MQAIHGAALAYATREFGLTSFIDFSSNLNVFAPVISNAEWSEWIDAAVKYPESDSFIVRQILADIYELDPQHVLATAGAIDGLYLAARLFPNRRVAVLQPAFSDYTRCFDSGSSQVTPIILPPRLWYQSLTHLGNALDPFDVVVLGNPNNPTGELRSRAELLEVIQRDENKSFIIDEAFIEFADLDGFQTLLPFIKQFPQVIILRSLTKSWCIPGLRLGFIATAGQINKLRHLQPPWAINGIAEMWVKDFLTRDRQTQLRDSLRNLALRRSEMLELLNKLPHLRVFRSAANFFLLEITDQSLNATDIYRYLGHRGLLVRVCDSFVGLPKGRFIRVAVRRSHENERLVQLLSEVLDRSERRVA
ncbi:MAG: pyridoxal phosphate-dependent class II aminotransferase [Verrucomicrobia bacterium]|nr:pyridoxal phosphate-dependent class II aminotransferase [Verrucomicrobiota bacterium]